MAERATGVVTVRFKCNKKLIVEKLYRYLAADSFLLLAGLKFIVHFQGTWTASILRRKRLPCQTEKL